MAGILGSIGKAASGFVSSTIARLTGAGLTRGADSPLTTSGEARWGGRETAKDWRVKLTLPYDSDLRSTFFTSDLMKPLSETGGIVFPLTPSVILQHQASYNPLALTHSNYPFYAYQHSEVSSFTCIGEFPVQNYEDAQSWVASLHFLRSVTKMFFGSGANQGNPPPILKFNGYGDHVFKNVPVVVTNFSVELTQGVDYISTARGERVQDIEASEGSITANSALPISWAPTMSMFNIQLQPVYSRESVKNFNMKDFVDGKLNNYGGSGNSEGVGFI